MEELLYLQKEADRLEKMKAGVIANPADWTGTGVTALTIQAHLDELLLSKKGVLDTDVLLHNNRLDAHKTAATGAAAADSLELKVKGVYSDNHDKWAEYGVDAHTVIAEEKKPVSLKGKIKSIKNNKDAAGFIVQGEALTNVDSYEWQRGIGTAGDSKIIPAFVHLITVNRANIVDNDVQPGVRYFYRYRGYSTAGFGEWCDPSSAIQ